MNILINIPAEIARENVNEHYFLNATINPSTNTITVTMDLKDLSFFEGNAITFPVPRLEIDTFWLAKSFAHEVNSLIENGSIIADDNCLILEDPWQVLSAIVALNYQIFPL